MARGPPHGSENFNPEKAMTQWTWVSRAGASVVTLLLFTAGPLNAQRTLERSGFFIGFGFGYGSLDITCDGCAVDREGGVSGYLKLGGALSERVLLGVESNGWYKSEEGVGITFGTLTGSVYLYPSSTANLYLRAGAGIATLDVEDFDTETGFGWSFGAGYDIPIGSRTGLTPFANWSFGDFDGGGTNVIQVGLGINWY